MTTKPWFSIGAKANGDKKSADIHIFDRIGSWDFSAKAFINALKQLDVEHINLHINSPGGYVFDGVAIQNSLRHHKAAVTVHIDGLAASTASVIALAGDEIRIADNAYVMIHNPVSMVYGEAKDMVKEAEVLNKISDGIAGDYSRKMGISIDDARELMDEETWYLGQEAIDSGFADTLFEGTKAAADFDLTRVSDKAPEEVIARFSQPKAAADKDKAKKTEDSKMGEEKKKEEKTEPKTPETTQKPKDTPVDEAAQADVDAAVKNALKADRQRQADIRALGKRFGFDDDAEKHAVEDTSVDDFRKLILDKSPDDWRASLTIKNPSRQASEQEQEDNEEGAAAVKQIKKRRQAKFGTA